MSVAQDQQVQYYFDFERDILGRTPPLSKVEPNLGLTVDSPPPLVPYDPSSESSEPDEEVKSRSPRRRKRRKGQTRPSQSDRVLISYLDHNRPDIALHAGRHALDSQSESEGESGLEEIDAPRDPAPSHMRSQDRVVHNAAPVVHMQSMVIVEGAPTTTRRDDFPMVDPPETISGGRRVQTPPASTLGLPENLAQHEARPYLKVEERRGKEWNVKPPPLELDLLRSPRDLGRGEEDSIVTSPALGKYTIQPPDADAIRLPALHKSPPRSSPAGSPEYRQTLPSIRNLTIPHFNDSSNMGFTGMSPMLNRPSPHMTETPTSYLQSPNPGMSPPEHPSRYSWRSSTRDSSISTSSEYTSTPSVTGSTPASSIILAQSPATSHPGSLSTLPEQEPANPREDQPPPRESSIPQSDSAEGHLLAGPFKCTFPGCNAIPFQTQYLLSSHMNVHSNQRPHFCPVKGCSRGVGGQGFKRKNEMIRCVWPKPFPIAVA